MKVIFRFAVLLFVVATAAMCWPSGNMMSNDIGCANANSMRGRQICTGLANSMRWTWMGHGIISPGWRITWDSLRDVFCTEHVTESDIPFLKSLSPAPDWRLESGAQDLIRLVENMGGKGAEPENSVFNPQNSQYVLKDGCRAGR